MVTETDTVEVALLRSVALSCILATPLGSSVGSSVPIFPAVIKVVFVAITRNVFSLGNWIPSVQDCRIVLLTVPMTSVSVVISLPSVGVVIATVGGAALFVTPNPL